MSRGTESEALFASYCAVNGLDCARIPEGRAPTPDYRLSVDGTDIFVEIEQIESTRGIDTAGVSTRTVGHHVRQKISEARKQVQASAHAGSPTMLLIYNKVDDPFQSFGTEPHDFIAAMYGEHTVEFVEGVVSRAYHGQRATLGEARNTSFSAVGHLRKTDDGGEITIYENVYAKFPLPYAAMPKCMRVIRVEVTNAT
jgi:hypothetical protein